MGPDTELNIRRMGRGDIEAVHQITGNLGLSRWSRADLIDELGRTDSYMLLAVLDNEPVGFVVGRRVPGTDADTFDAEVYNIGVTSELHGKGIGKTLFARFIDEALKDDVINIWLEVRAGNLSAIRFYRQLGFTEVTSRKAFYQAPVEDAVIMQATVSGCYEYLNKESLK